MNTIDSLRAQIDAVDEKIVTLLANRAQIVHEIGKLKKKSGLLPLDKTRWQRVIADKVHQAKILGISPDHIVKVWNVLHEWSLEIESRV